MENLLNVRKLSNGKKFVQREKISSMGENLFNRRGWQNLGYKFLATLFKNRHRLDFLKIIFPVTESANAKFCKWGYLFQSFETFILK